MTMLAIASQFFDAPLEPVAEVQNFTLVARTWNFRNSSGYHPQISGSSLSPLNFTIGGNTYNITAWIIRDSTTFAHEDFIISFNSSVEATNFVTANLYLQDGRHSRTFRTGGVDRNGNEIQWRFSDLNKYVTGTTYTPRISTGAF